MHITLARPPTYNCRNCHPLHLPIASMAVASIASMASMAEQSLPILPLISPIVEFYKKFSLIFSEPISILCDALCANRYLSRGSLVGCRSAYSHFLPVLYSTVSGYHMYIQTIIRLSFAAGLRLIVHR